MSDDGLAKFLAQAPPDIREYYTRLVKESEQLLTDLDKLRAGIKKDSGDKLKALMDTITIENARQLNLDDKRGKAEKLRLDLLQNGYESRKAELEVRAYNEELAEVVASTTKDLERVTVLTAQIEEMNASEGVADRERDAALETESEERRLVLQDDEVLRMGTAERNKALAEGVDIVASSVKGVMERLVLMAKAEALRKEKFAAQLAEMTAALEEHHQEKENMQDLKEEVTCPGKEVGAPPARNDEVKKAREGSGGSKTPATDGSR